VEVRADSIVYRRFDVGHLWISPYRLSIATTAAKLLEVFGVAGTSAAAALLGTVGGPG
jgi:hypothetical protein